MLTGTLLPYAGATVPAGYLECDGSAVSRSTYAALFDVIGTTYGAGDGLTTFNVPDFRGRSLLGAGTGPGLSPRDRGQTGGAERVTLGAEEMPAHGHDYSVPAGISTSTQSVQTAMDVTVLQTVTLDGGSGTTASTGGGQAHENMPPFGVAMWIVKA